MLGIRHRADLEAVIFTGGYGGSPPRRAAWRCTWCLENNVKLLRHVCLANHDVQIVCWSIMENDAKRVGAVTHFPPDTVFLFHTVSWQQRANYSTRFKTPHVFHEEGC